MGNWLVACGLCRCDAGFACSLDIILRVRLKLLEGGRAFAPFQKERGATL
jgi:hypothetical protein